MLADSELHADMTADVVDDQRLGKQQNIRAGDGFILAFLGERCDDAVSRECSFCSVEYYAHV